MCEDPSFGTAETYYVDNGKEFLFADFLDDAMQLTVESFADPGFRRSSRVVRAIPYNAPAKPIERWFGDFERRYLSKLPGYIAGDRMNKRQEAVGRTVRPFGTFAAFKSTFFGLLQAYEGDPTTKGSGLGGLSPADAFRRHVDAGWAATIISRDELRAACSRAEPRRVVQGAISVAGIEWTCPALDEVLDDTVLVRIPAYHAPQELLVLNTRGERIGIAKPVQALHPLDTRGARQSAARSKAHHTAIRDLEKAAPPADVPARLIASGKSRPRVVPNPPNGVIRFDPTSRPPRAAVPASLPSDAELEAARRKEIADHYEIQRALIRGTLK